MITPKGYSKDPTIMPDAIVLTLAVAFFEERNMTTDQFRKVFERQMSNEDTIWHFKLSNLPIQDVLYVYLVFDGHIQYRANLVMYERDQAHAFCDAPDGVLSSFPTTNWVLFAGPLAKPVEPWPQKGFQGFRYATKLF